MKVGDSPGFAQGIYLSTKYLSIIKYWNDPRGNIAKGLWFPTIRGTWLPSFDVPGCFGLAINWLGVRVRVSTGNLGKVVVR